MRAPTVSASTVEYEQATLYRRLAARAIDVAIAVIVLLPLSMGVVVLIGQATGSAVTAEASGWVAAVCLLMSSIAYDAVMTHLLGRTLGKMALRLRVIDSRGARLAWGPSFLRATVMCATTVVVVFLIVVTASILGWVLVRGMSTYARLPHDRVSKSFVVCEVKGEPKGDHQRSAATDSAGERSPLADLERLREQGMISEEEYARKRREVGL